MTMASEFALPKEPFASMAEESAARMVSTTAFASALVP